MAIGAKEMYDYLSAVSIDKSTTLSTPTPQKILSEIGTKNQVVHLAADGSEERIGLSNQSIFHVTLKWDYLKPPDAGVIMDFWNSSNLGHGRLNSFRWDHPTDGHRYVVRFADDVTRTIMPSSIHEISQIRLKILGTT